MCWEIISFFFSLFLFFFFCSYTFDSSIQVTEVKSPNSGIEQGDFIKRSKVAKVAKNQHGKGGSGSLKNTTFSSTASSIMGGPSFNALGYYTVNDFFVRNF